MKLLAASLSSLLVTTASAFRTAGLPQKILPCHHYHHHPSRISTTILKGSYLDDLSNAPSAQSRASTTAASTSPTTTTTGTQMNLDVADLLSNSVIATAKRNNFPPIVVSVLDKQANMLVQKRMDGDVHVAFPDFSYAKAYTCVALDVSSREFRDKYTTQNDASKIAQLNSMMSISQGKMAAFPGGILLRNEENVVIGAVGVSGAAGDEDEYAALRGVWDSGLGLSTWPAEHSCTTALD
mmetsp:Transcript_27436/g.57261  ORF Transcript_27436/g.57261 Transcript_27436/m.57261 type:complete len:239 (+) Transcript_27436:167-883(+)